MRQIALHKLILRDFKGMTFTLDAHGEDINVYGRNATGKTTLADAFSWLLFDKDSLGRSDFEIKNLNADGEAQHGLEHSVEAVLHTDVNEPPLDKLPDGSRTESVTLKKVYKELWTKKRGSPTETFTGHTTDYFINTVPVQKKDYVQRVAELAGDESVFRLLTSPTAFPALHWQKRRELLLEVCGDITDADVIASDAKLTGLPEILGGHKLDDFKKIIASRRTEINKELEKIPVRIDEQRRSLPDIAGLNREVIASDIHALETEIADHKLKAQGVDTGGGIAELTKKLAGISADLQKTETQHYAETMKTVNRLSQQITEATNKLNSDRRRVSGLTTEVASRTAAIAAFERDIQTHRDKWNEIDGQTFQDTTAEACAACGQALPADRVQEAREKARAAFNSRKAERLEEITKTGHRYAAERDRQTISVEAQQKEITDIEAGFPAAENQVKTLTAERDALKAQAEDYTIIGPAYDALTAQKVEVEAALRAEREGRATDSVMLREAITVAESKLRAHKENADRFVRREQGERRIEDLKAEEKNLAAEFERLEAELFLCEQFVRTKVRMLTDRINGQFEIAQWKLFDVQVNQGLSECCEITVDGIPYSGGLNNAARINAGLDICRTLARHYGLQAPVFVDNAESVCELIDMPAQVIRLVVTQLDATLRVEPVRHAVAA